MPMVSKRTPGTDDWAQWMSPSHPETARRARVRHVDHGRLEHREGRRPHPRRLRRVGRALAPPCDPGDRRRPLRRGDLPDRGEDARRLHEELRRRRAPAPRQHHREDGVAEAAAPRDRGLPDHRGQRVGRQRRRRRDDDREQRLRRRPRPHAARQDRVVGVDRDQPARHRSRADPLDPEGARRVPA